LEVEREQRLSLAIAAERTRISREMHDILGHNLAVFTGLAGGGARIATTAPNRAAQALRSIADTSRQALSELRNMPPASPTARSPNNSYCPNPP
jgi:signal transduction histidine kinase